MMEIVSLGINGAWLIKFNRIKDSRGEFKEWFKRDEFFKKTGIDFKAEQANVSINTKGALRGIHYSLSSAGQAKWISCMSGEILDVVVDIRPNSPTFKQVIYVDLKQEDGSALFINSGLGHGFIAKLDNTIVSYLLSSKYSPLEEFEINPLDDDLNIMWNLALINKSQYIISEKDSNAPSLNERLNANKLPS